MALINDEEFDNFLAESVTIDEQNISKEFIQLSSQMAYWARRAAAAEEAYLVAKAELKEAESRAFLHVRELLMEQEKRPTVDHINAMLHTTPSVMAANRELAAAAAARKELQSTLDAISAKKDMLSQIGADRRQEMKSFNVS